MLTLQFFPQRVNVNGRWRAAAVWQGNQLTADRLISHLHNRCGLDRHTMDALVAALQEFVLTQLVEGNQVNLFDLVRLSPHVDVNLPSVPTQAEAQAMAGSVKPADVNCRVGCQSLLDFNRRFLNRLRRRRLTSALAGTDVA